MNNKIKFLKPYFYPFLVLAISLGVYFPFYGSPQSMFWDENYHIVSAQKHIDGVMYMEPHPPLGKMLMALAEIAFGDNSDIDKSKMLVTDYLNGSDTPANLNFTGYRWPSVVMMAISALFFFGILHRITRLAWLAAAFSSLIIFDNALVMHSRAAMLEGIQLFFILAAIYYLVRIATQFLHQKKAILLRHYAILGLIIGLAISVKINAFILLLLFVVLFGIDQWTAIQKWQWRNIVTRLLLTAPVGAGSVILIFLAIFYVHIGMGKTIKQDRTYKASAEYQQQIHAGNTWSPKTFVIGMRDNWKYMSEYAGGVPKLDYCKADENGSYAMGWPLSSRTISYRWSKETVDGETNIYFNYLIGNPIIWFSVLIGIILSSTLILGRFVYNAPIKDQPLFGWMCVFTGLYLSYMIAILQIERVMYLYHYFIPLVFGAINLSLLITYLFRDELIGLNRHTLINLTIFISLVIGIFAFFSPFTYSFGLTENEFQLRNWFQFWHLRPVY
jgi:dolichyl-phosphate-mannose-protein mannosyltransferase